MKDKAFGQLRSLYHGGELILDPITHSYCVKPKNLNEYKYHIQFELRENDLYYVRPGEPKIVLNPMICNNPLILLLIYQNLGNYPITSKMIANDDINFMFEPINTIDNYPKMVNISELRINYKANINVFVIEEFLNIVNHSTDLQKIELVLFLYGQTPTKYLIELVCNMSMTVEIPPQPTISLSRLLIIGSENYKKIQIHTLNLLNRTTNNVISYASHFDKILNENVMISEEGIIFESDNSCCTIL
jgi:hypothetical protein